MIIICQFEGLRLQKYYDSPFRFRDLFVRIGFAALHGRRDTAWGQEAHLLSKPRKLTRLEVSIVARLHPDKAEWQRRKKQHLGSAHVPFFDIFPSELFSVLERSA